MAALSLLELRKRAGRIEVFLNKLATASPFELVTTANITANILYQYKGKDLIKSFNPSNSIEFTSAQKELNTSTLQFFIGREGSDKRTPITALLKTFEFGGKGIGGSTLKEDAALLQLREAIFTAIKGNKGPIQISIGSTIYKDVIDVVTTKGTTKSDFHIINSNETPIIWISHKDGRTPKDFQQWGGISDRKEPVIFKHIETQKFISDIKKDYPNGLPPATSLYRKIKDNTLKMLSVYGNKYNTNILGEQNVSILLQGPIGLMKYGDYYKLTANHIHTNGDSVDNDGFEPVFMAIYKGDRSDAGIKGTRVVIMPILGRKAKEFIKGTK